MGIRNLGTSSLNLKDDEGINWLLQVAEKYSKYVIEMQIYYSYYYFLNFVVQINECLLLAPQQRLFLKSRLS